MHNEMRQFIFFLSSGNSYFIFDILYKKVSHQIKTEPRQQYNAVSKNKKQKEITNKGTLTTLENKEEADCYTFFRIIYCQICGELNLGIIWLEDP